MDISTGSFVKILFDKFSEIFPSFKTPLLLSELLHYGHIRGWLEDQDERFPDSTLDRRTAARIIHNFMRLELQIPDLPDISPATRLADLYTCPACVNHVAQVFCRGIMEKHQTERDGQIFDIFDMLSPVTKTEADTIIIVMLTLRR